MKGTVSVFEYSGFKGEISSDFSFGGNGMGGEDSFSDPELFKSSGFPFTGGSIGFVSWKFQ